MNRDRHSMRHKAGSQTTRRVRVSHGLRAGLIAALALPASLPAADTVLTPSLDIGGLYESNPVLNRFAEEEVFGPALDGRLKIRINGPKTRFAFDPRAFLTFYPDEEDKPLEDRNYYLPVSFTYATPLSSTSISAGYSDTNLRRALLETAGGGEAPGSPDILFIGDKQRRFYVDPSWNYLLTPRTNLQVSGGYSRVRFDQTAVTGLIALLDYDYLYGNLSLDRNLTERATLGLLANVSQFDAEDRNSGIENDSLTYGLSAFLNYEFGNKWSGSATFGLRNTESEVTRRPFINIGGQDLCVDVGGFLAPCNQAFEGDNYVGEVSVRREGRRTSLDFSVGRNITPNSLGAETVRDTLRGTLRRELTPRLTADLDLLYWDQETVAGVTAFANKYLSARVDLRWRFWRQWSLRGAYRFVRIRDVRNFVGVAQNTSADNNYVFFGIGWQGLGWRP